MLWARTALQCTCFLFATFEDVEFSDLGAEHSAYLVRYESNLAETFVPANMSWVTDINQENSLTNSLRSQCSLIQMFTPHSLCESVHCAPFLHQGSIMSSTVQTLHQSCSLERLMSPGRRGTCPTCHAYCSLMALGLLRAWVTYTWCSYADYLSWMVCIKASLLLTCVYLCFSFATAMLQVPAAVAAHFFCHDGTCWVPPQVGLYYTHTNSNMHPCYHLV